MTKFGGILPALVTPFDANGCFDVRPFKRLLGRVYAAGVHGVYVNGSTGEGLLQPVEQRKRVLEAAVENSPAGKQVIVHTGAVTTAQAVELTRHAAQAGAHAVSSLPPPGNYTFGEVKAYYETLAAASEVPLILYFFPAASQAITTADQLTELCAIPNVAGVKFTSYDLFTLSTIKAIGVRVFNGYDEVLAAGLLMGADGGIGTIYSLAPEAFVRLYEAARHGRWEDARRLQEEINVLIRVIVRYPVFPATKAALRWAGIDCGMCLPPRRSLSATEEASLREELANIGSLMRTPAGAGGV